MRRNRTQATYTFMCLRCEMTWAWIYEVREGRDRAGNEWRIFFREGAASASPEFGVACPYCAGLRVKVLPLRTGVAGIPASEGVEAPGRHG
ncbi:MAG TPA: hypothetical protein VID47_02395 [Actinomycetota bacterium]|jgi:hypothetical protein